MKKLKIAITIGDFNGIGPEVVLKSIANSAIKALCTPILIGSQDIFEYYAQRFKMNLRFSAIDALTDRLPSVEIPVMNVGNYTRKDIAVGQVSKSAGRCAGLALEKSVKLCLEKKVDAVVTAPVSKVALNLAGYHFPGQTEMLAHLTHSKRVVMMFVSRTMRVGLVTVHLPLRDVSNVISKQTITEKIFVMHNSLQQDFGIQRPRIAILGLNPHVGEDGMLGKEDQNVIAPAITLAKKRKIDVTGPYPADGFFGHYWSSRRNAHPKYFDAILAMYHDQGLIPLKMASFGRSVNFSAGLNIIRTSPDHGTAVEIAGQGIANPQSMMEAIRLAVAIAKRRMSNN